MQQPALLDCCYLYFVCVCICFKIIFPPPDRDVTSTIEEMETMILECARLDTEINYFVDTVKQVTSEVMYE